MRKLLGTCFAAASVIAAATFLGPSPAQAITLATPAGLGAAIQEASIKQDVWWGRRAYWGHRRYGYRPYAAYAYAYRPRVYSYAYAYRPRVYSYAYAYRPYAYRPWAYSYGYRPWAYSYGYRPWAYSYAYRPYAYRSYAYAGFGRPLWFGWRRHWW